MLEPIDENIQEYIPYYKRSEFIYPTIVALILGFGQMYQSCKISKGFQQIQGFDTLIRTQTEQLGSLENMLQKMSEGNLKLDSSLHINSILQRLALTDDSNIRRSQINSLFTTTYELRNTSLQRMIIIKHRCLNTTK